MQPITAPESSEYDTYYGRYIDQVGESLLLDQLSGQVDDTLKLLHPLSDAQAAYRYSADKWSIKEVIGHVIDTERVFTSRALHFARGNPEPLPGFDQDPYVVEAHSDDVDLRALLAELEAVRRSTVAMFRNMPGSALGRRGIASGCEFTVRAVLFIIAGHELHHRRVLEEKYMVRA